MDRVPRLVGDLDESEYVNPRGAVRSETIIDALTAVLGLPESSWRHGGLAMPRLRSVEVFLDYDCDGPDTARLAIEVADGDSAAGHHLAWLIHHAWSTRTDWIVDWSSRPDPIQGPSRHSSARPRHLHAVD